MKLKKPFSYWSALGISALTLAACDPVPTRTLTTEEKIYDLGWIYSQFGENYAPMEMKLKSRVKSTDETYVNVFEKLKTDYIEAAKKTTTNAEFYDLMFEFVAEFKDAHTSASLANPTIAAYGDQANRPKVAFLGFSGIRNGDSLKVKKLLSTIASGSAYPIKLNDEILKINGRSLKEAIDQDLVKYRNLGNSEANYTFHMNKLFTRVSTANGLPKEKDALLVVKRGTKEIEVSLPWVTKDTYQFKEDQSKAEAAKKKPTSSGDDDGDDDRVSRFVMVSDEGTQAAFRFNFLGFDGRVENPMKDLQKIMTTVQGGMKRKFEDGFKLIDHYAQWNVVEAKEEAKKAPLEALSEQRKLLDNAMYLTGSDSYPAYITPQDALDKEGKKTGEKKLVGYIYLDTFSPSKSVKLVEAEFKKTLSTFQSMGVKEIIIDTINNGGGSLVLGMKLAQALSPKKIIQPEMQFRLSDSWLNQFQSEFYDGKSDAEQEYARRILDQMVSKRQENKQRLSDRYSAEILAPFAINGNEDLEKPFKVVLLVNEMCASMCDIFAGILQDNKMATIMGARTMGAGGNVVNYSQAPNSHIEVRQTESLMIRKDGTYLENAGVTPDVVMEVNKSADKKYAAVLEKAVEVLMK